MKVAVFNNKLKTFFSKPQNIILLLFGLLMTVVIVAPLISIALDTVSTHPGSPDQAHGDKYTTFNWSELFTGTLAKNNLWIPLGNSVALSVFACLGAILFGGIFAYFVSRTNLKLKKYLSAIFIFPYIMPQWALAIIWKDVFTNTVSGGSSVGLLSSFTGINMPHWWYVGLFPTIVILSIHYAPFAYLLIGSIFRNMDSNLEEAAVILNTPKRKIFTKITLPLITPAVLSTVLLVFGSSMGSYPVPHYFNLETLSTKYVGLKVQREGQASILGIIMILFGVALLIANQMSTKSKKSYTTVTGKSGQIKKVNLKYFNPFITTLLVIVTFFTSIFPILFFALQTFLPNPGDYSIFKTGNFQYLTTKWWTSQVDKPEMFGQKGILYNTDIWKSFGGTILVAISAALLAGTAGLMIGYAVSKNRKSKFSNYVNNVSFLPYLIPSIAIGISFFIFGSAVGIYDTYILLIIVGTIKYIPFASRSSLNSMLQISGEIEEAAIIQGASWPKRMIKIMIPIQKAAIISGYLLPFMTAVRELTLFMLLADQKRISTTMISYFDEMNLPAFSSGINLLIILFILLINFIVNKLTKASLDQGIGGK